MRILIIGDAILDEFILCEPGTSSGGEAILVERERVYRPGGAAGVACVAQDLGAEVIYFSPVSHFGADFTGLRREPRELKNQHELLGGHCGRIARIRCSGQREIRIDREKRILGGSHLIDIQHADAVILADYNKGALDREERQRIIRLCNECGVPCVVGAARGVDWSEYKGATCISATQNEAWAAGYPQCGGGAWGSVSGLFCLTADVRGLRVVTACGAPYEARYAVDEVDPLGCGDSVVAALAIGLAEQMPLDALSRFAAAVGAVQAGKGPGTQPVSRAEVDALLGAAVSA